MAQMRAGGCGSLPRLRANLSLGWEKHGHAFTAIVRYIGDYKDDSNPIVDAGGDPVLDGNGREILAKIAWLTTLDAQYAFTLDDVFVDRLTFKIGVINAIGSDPPKTLSQYGFDPLVHDPRGRVVYGRIASSF